MVEQSNNKLPFELFCSLNQDPSQKDALIQVLEKHGYRGLLTPVAGYMAKSRLGNNDQAPVEVNTVFFQSLDFEKYLDAHSAESDIVTNLGISAQVWRMLPADKKEVLKKEFPTFLGNIEGQIPPAAIQRAKMIKHIGERFNCFIEFLEKSQQTLNP